MSGCCCCSCRMWPSPVGAAAWPLLEQKISLLLQTLLVWQQLQAFGSIIGAAAAASVAAILSTQCV